MKRCSRCRVDKDESAFFRCAKNRDGLQSYCKECDASSHRRVLSGYDWRSRPSRHCAACWGLPWRRPVGGCPSCGLPFAEETQRG